MISGNDLRSGTNEIHNAGGTVNADSNNLFGDSSLTDAQAFNGFTPGMSDINATSDGTNVALASILNTTLADNGGDTLTHALVSGSPAIDAGNNTVCASSGIDNLDQRGAARAGGAGSGGSTCDIGAYEFDSPPLAVNLASFTADADTEQVRIQWQTVLEQDNLGFNLYRATDVDGEQIRLNSDLIPAQAPGSGQGSAYEFVDEQVTEGESYFYWLEDMDLNGQTTRHGPVSATTDMTTAITLEGFSIDVPTISLWTLIAFMLTLLMGGWVLRRNAR